MVERPIELKNSDELININENFKLIAGPGAGKTRFLINHIKNVIKNSDKLQNNRRIACITHTNIAVETIKERLENSINEVEVTTIHSFLYKHVVKPYLWTVKAEFGLNINLMKSIKEVFPSHSLVNNRSSWQLRSYDITEQNLFSLLEKMNWTFEDNEIKLKTPYITLPSNFLRDYKKEAWKKGLLSPDDILFFSYHILNKNNKITEILKIKFPYIFLDEFQDTSSLQSEIIKLIANSGITIGIIGDYAQSIFGFQGADVDSFLNFKIDEKINNYVLKNNHRSNDAIVKILNHIRQDDFKQHCCQKENKSKIEPLIIVGNDTNAYIKLKETFNSTNFYSLTYKSNNINGLNFKLQHKDVYEHISEKMLNKIFETETNYHRRRIIRYTILSIESFRKENIKNALKFMKYAYRNNFNDDYTALKNLFRLNSQYDSFITLSITEFYNNFIHNYFRGLPKITKATVKEKYYDKYRYIDFALNLNKSENNSKFRTIHSCKGDEFDNVMLFIESEDDLEFLLEPNIEKETHRVYYVALSRAKDNIAINTPTLTKNHEKSLKEIGFQIIYLS